MPAMHHVPAASCGSTAVPTPSQIFAIAVHLAKHSDESQAAANGASDHLLSERCHDAVRRPRRDADNDRRLLTARAGDRRGKGMSAIAAAQSARVVVRRGYANGW